VISFLLSSLLPPPFAEASVDFYETVRGPEDEEVFYVKDGHLDVGTVEARDEVRRLCRDGNKRRGIPRTGEKDVLTCSHDVE